MALCTNTPTLGCPFNLGTQKPRVTTPGGRGKTRELRQTALPVHSSVPNRALSSPPSSALQFETIAPQPLGMIDHPEVVGPCNDMPLQACHLLGAGLTRVWAGESCLESL